MKTSSIEAERDRLHSLSRHLCYDVRGHDQQWRNDVAKDLNLVLSRVEYVLATSFPALTVDVEFARAAIGLVERVADFEGVSKAPTVAKSATVPLSQTIDLRRDREENGGEMM